MDIVRLKAKIIEGTIVHPVFGETYAIQTILVDETTGRHVPSPELIERHQQGTAVGYCVKLRVEYITRPDLTDLVMVEDAREGEVKVGGLWMTVQDFTKYYEPD